MIKLLRHAATIFLLSATVSLCLPCYGAPFARFRSSIAGIATPEFPNASAAVVFRRLGENGVSVSWADDQSLPDTEKTEIGSGKVTVNTPATIEIMNFDLPLTFSIEQIRFGPVGGEAGPSFGQVDATQQGFSRTITFSNPLNSVATIPFDVGYSVHLTAFAQEGATAYADAIFRVFDAVSGQDLFRLPTHEVFSSNELDLPVTATRNFTVPAAVSGVPGTRMVRVFGEVAGLARTVPEPRSNLLLVAAGLALLAVRSRGSRKGWQRTAAEDQTSDPA